MAVGHQEDVATIFAVTILQIRPTDERAGTDPLDMPVLLANAEADDTIETEGRDQRHENLPEGFISSLNGRKN